MRVESDSSKDGVLRCEQLRQLWRVLVVRLGREAEGLPAAEREWIGCRLMRIGEIQQNLQALFTDAGGVSACKQCGGGCCERGIHHLTLVNLLHWLLAGEAPPEPDFAATCPFLGAVGCRLPAARRPFNCIIFFCEKVEERLSLADRATFRRLEGQLREIYLAFDRRYAGSSLRGLLIRAETLG